MLLPLLTLPLPALALVAPKPVFAEPVIILPTLQISAKRFTRYNPAGRKEPVYGQWSWVPRGEFTIRGPLEGGSQLVVNVTKPDGSAWLSLPLDTPELAEGERHVFKLPDLEEQKAIPVGGVCGFQIVLKNVLASTTKTLFSGKFTVKTFKTPFEKTPGATEFYVDHDWVLPLGYLAIDTQVSPEAPILDIRLWLKGKTEQITGHLASYIFYKGKQIASSQHKNDTGSPDEIGMSYDQLLTTPGMNAGDPIWFRLRLSCMKVRVYHDLTKNADTPYTTEHFLAANPGEYELKLLRDGKLIRSAKFSVDAKGLLVNDGISAKLNTLWYFLPIKVEPGAEPPASLTTYKTGAFYANPISGFIAP